MKKLFQDPFTYVITGVLALAGFMISLIYNSFTPEIPYEEKVSTLTYFFIFIMAASVIATIVALICKKVRKNRYMYGKW